MKENERYWEIWLEKHTETIFREKINTKHISEKNLQEFIKVILSKYTLSDAEILECYISIPFKEKKNYITVTRRNSNLNEPLNICFCAQVADYSISVNLIT